MNFREVISKIKNKLINKGDLPAEDGVINDDDAIQEDAVKEKNETLSFAESLRLMTADDIAPPAVKKQDAAQIRKNIIRYVATAVFGCIFIGSAATLIRSLVGYRRGDEIYSEIADNIFEMDLSGERAVSLMSKSNMSAPMPDYYTGLLNESSDGDLSDTVEINAEFEQMKANLTYLKSQNPDIYGYIHIDGTNISYPIVQGEDNDYYLNRTWNGEYVVVGSIYADFRADRTLENNLNTVFYGHNMNDGKMFNNVMNFLEEDVFNNKVILIYTFDGVYTFEPFAIFQTVYTYPYFRMEFADDADFIAFCEEMQKQSVHNKNMTFTGDDRIITLSTCTPSYDASSYYVGRYALHAKLVKVES